MPTQRVDGTTMTAALHCYVAPSSTLMTAEINVYHGSRRIAGMMRHL